MSRFNAGDLVSGKYRIVRMIGDGGMGVVYEARHEVLGHGVALKFLHAELAQRPGLTQRFLQEARVSATIQSVHVAHVTDVDTAQDGSPYLVMELLAGQSLQGMLDRERQLRTDVAVDFGLQILAGLEAAHAIGVVHRDMKPDNVLVTPSSGGPLLKLIDFGIAKLRASSEYAKGLTRAGVVMGTPEYMAPEQLMSAQDTDHRADLYSLGVMLFEMLAGCRPADGDDVELIIAAVSAGRVRKLQELVPGLPPGLVALIERATQAEREQRFDSAAEMRLALAAFAGQLSHAGRLAAMSEPLTPLATPASAALLSLAPPVAQPLPAFPKTLPPDAGGPLSVSQLGGARTSVSEDGATGAGGHGGTAMGGPAQATPPHQYGASPQYGAPPQYVVPHAGSHASTPRKRRSGLLIFSVVLVIVGGGGAVGYAAYRAMERPVVVPPLPDVGPVPTSADTVEKVNPETPDGPSISPPGREPSTPRSTGTGTRAPTGGAGGSGGAGTLPVAGSSSGGSGAGPVVVTTNGGGTTVQLPFPLPSGIQIPPIQLPPGMTFPPGFPGVPQPGTGTAPTAAPPTTPPAATPTAEPTTAPTAAPSRTPRRRTPSNP